MLRLSVAWRVACGDAPTPSSLVIESRSCWSAPTCGFRGIDGGKNVRGVKIHIAVDKHGSPFAVEVGPANEHDAKGIRPVLEQISDLGFEGGVLGDLWYRGAPLDEFAKGIGMLGVDAVAGGRGGVFVPAGLRWTVERTFAWASRYRKAEHEL
jgi:transposase